MEKYDTYSVESSPCQRIDLHKNFRSRKEVLDSTNYLFEKLMFREFGGIEYDENAALYAGAEFPPIPEDAVFTDKTEVLIFNQQDMKARDAKEAEARMIARRIREMMGSGYIYDKGSDSFRKIQYKDIVILTRSIQGWAESFSAVLAEEGIPAYSVSREGYFETYEISVLLDYLRKMCIRDRIEHTPFMHDEKLLGFCRENEIQVMAWGPLLRGNLDEDEIGRMAAGYNKTSAQLLLRWNVQQGIIPIPKSKNKERLLQNISISDFEITEEDMKRMNAMNQNKRTSYDPMVFDF